MCFSYSCLLCVFLIVLHVIMCIFCQKTCVFGYAHVHTYVYAWVSAHTYNTHTCLAWIVDMDNCKNVFIKHLF